MKISKFVMLASVSLGLAALATACTEDTERPDSRFWIGDKPVDSFATNSSKNSGNGGIDLTSGNGFGENNGENNKPGEYGEFIEPTIEG